MQDCASPEGSGSLDNDESPDDKVLTVGLADLQSPRSSAGNAAHVSPSSASRPGFFEARAPAGHRDDPEHEHDAPSASMLNRSAQRTQELFGGQPTIVLELMRQRSIACSLIGVQLCMEGVVGLSHSTMCLSHMSWFLSPNCCIRV